MFMEERKFAFNGDEMPVQFSQLSCPSDPLIDHHNWENNLMGQNSVSESRPITSSLATSNSVVSTNGIVVEDQFPAITTLGSLCNSANIPPRSQILMGRSKSFNIVSSYSAPSLASPTKFKHLLMDQQVRNELPDLGNSIQSLPNSESFSDNPALNERAVRFLSSGSRSFSGLIGKFELNETNGGSGKRSRVSSNQVFNAAESLTCSRDEEEGSASALELKFSQLLSSSAHELAEFTNAEEKDSKKITDMDVGLIAPNGSNSRKRKAIARGKAEELPSSSSATDIKTTEADAGVLNLQTSMPSQIIGDESDVVKSNENRILERQTDCTSRPREPPKDYIHVRARRGQATDSHSLAERVRREKISKRMKLLQDLVPGCHNVTGKAVMLDEIINYVQSLQRQVQFLSMKLATVNPRLDFNMEAMPSEDILHMIRPLHSSVLAHQQEQATQRCFSNGMETLCMLNPTDPPYKDLTMQVPHIGECWETATYQVQTIRDDDLQSLVQKHLGQLQIQELEFSRQSSHGSPPT